MDLSRRKGWNVLVTTYQLATGDKLDKKFLKDQAFNVGLQYMPPCRSMVLT